jgi:hypothetical protein
VAHVKGSSLWLDAEDFSQVSLQINDAPASASQDCVDISDVSSLSMSALVLTVRRSTPLAVDRPLKLLSPGNARVFATRNEQHHLAGSAPGPFSPGHCQRKQP